MPRSHASFTHADISRDTQLCLDEAARLAFPDGTVSARTLRAESARGKLVIFRIGKKFYTTLAEIDRMVEKCPALPKAHISISGDGQAGFLPSSSGMDAMKSAQLKQAAAHGSLSLMTPMRSHVDLTEAPLAKDGVTQYEATTLLLSKNMVLRL